MHWSFIGLFIFLVIKLSKEYYNVLPASLSLLMELLSGQQQLKTL